MRIVFSCVTDRSPTYDYQALVWATTLLRLSGRSADDLVVHTTARRGKVLRQIEDMGVEVVPIEQFDPGWPLAHKLVQLRSPAIHGRGPEYVVLRDCDLAFCNDPSPWVGGRFRAKPVDRANPPIELWQQLFRQEGLPEAPEESLPTHSSTPTYARNVNAGVLIMPAAMLEDLVPAWAHWYGRAQGHRALLGSYARHIIQIALALALRELDVTVEYLPPALNFPAHISSSDPHAVDDDPVVLHYHHHVNSAGLLKPSGLPQVDAAIRKINAALERETTPVYRKWVRPPRGLTHSFRR